MDKYTLMLDNILDHTYQPKGENPIIRVSATLDITSPTRERFSSDAIDNFIQYVLSLQIQSFKEFQNTIIGRYIEDLRGVSIFSEPSVQHTLLTKAIVDLLINFQVYFSDREGILSLVVALFTSDIFVNNSLLIDFITNVFKVKISPITRYLLQTYNIPFFTFVLNKLRSFFSSLNGREEELFNMYFKPFSLNVLDIIFFESKRKDNLLTDSTEIKLLLAFVYFIIQKNKEKIPFEIDFSNRAVNFSEKDIDDVIFKYASVGGHWSVRMFNVIFNLIQSIASSIGIQVPTFFVSFGKKEFINEFINFSSTKKSSLQKTMNDEEKTHLKILLKNFLEMCKPGKCSLLYQAVQEGNEIARSLICASLKIPESSTGLEDNLSSTPVGGKTYKGKRKNKKATRRKRSKMVSVGGNIIPNYFKTKKETISSPPMTIDWQSEIMKIQKTVNVNIDISVFSRYLETVAKRVNVTGSQVQIEFNVKMSSIKQWAQYGNSLIKLKVADTEKFIDEVFVLRQDNSFKLFYKLSKTPLLQVQVFKYSFYYNDTKPGTVVRIKFSNNENHAVGGFKLF